jgi:hypothetical protein
VRETTQAVRELPSRQYIGWDDSDTARIEGQLGERQSIRDDVSA